MREVREAHNKDAEEIARMKDRLKEEEVSVRQSPVILFVSEPWHRRTYECSIGECLVWSWGVTHTANKCGFGCVWLGSLAAVKANKTCPFGSSGGRSTVLSIFARLV